MGRADALRRRPVPGRAVRRRRGRRARALPPTAPAAAARRRARRLPARLAARRRRAGPPGAAPGPLRRGRLPGPHAHVRAPRRDRAGARSVRELSHGARRRLRRRSRTGDARAAPGAAPAGAVADTVDPPFVGRERSSSRCGRPGSVLEEHRPAAFLVAGPSGSGRTRFVREVSGRVAAPRRGGPRGRAPGHLGPRTASRCWSSSRTCDARTRPASPPSATCCRRGGPRAGPRHRAADEAEPDHPLLDAGRLPAARPAPAVGRTSSRSCCVRCWELHRRAPGGRADGADRRSARRRARDRATLLSTGQLLSTSDGLVRAPWNPARTPVDSGARLLRARRQTAPHGGTAVDLLAVLDRPTPVAELSRLADVARPSWARCWSSCPTSGGRGRTRRLPAARSRRP